jgi:hypothetical protein
VLGVKWLNGGKSYSYQRDEHAAFASVSAALPKSWFSGEMYFFALLSYQAFFIDTWFGH